jgi:hypothetical protein
MDKSLSILKVKDPKYQINPLDIELHPHLPIHPHTIIFLAQPRSGKTNLICNLLANPNFYNCQKYWDEVIYISPTQIFDKTAMQILPKLNNIMQIHDHQDLLRIDVILEDIKNRQMKLLKETDPLTGKPKVMERILIVFDDCLSYLKEDDSLGYFISKFRHFNCSVWCTTQSFRKLPPIIRNCAGNIIHFQLANERELEKVEEEYGVSFGKNYSSISKEITKKKYDFVYMDLENLKLYHNFDTLVLDKGDVPF